MCNIWINSKLNKTFPKGLFDLRFLWGPGYRIITFVKLSRLCCSSRQCNDYACMHTPLSPETRQIPWHIWLIADAQIKNCHGHEHKQAINDRDSTMTASMFVMYCDSSNSHRHHHREPGRTATMLMLAGFGCARKADSSCTWLIADAHIKNCHGHEHKLSLLNLL